jgi:phosphoglycolate phosphatase-like HAD superfamily hydrolase
VNENDPLRSWNDGQSKRAILDFVGRVTQAGGPEWVPPEERVATFDNDGTLWCEQPMPVQFDFILRRMAAIAEQNPSLRQQYPWKAAYAYDTAWVVDAIVKHYQGDDSDIKALIGGVLKAFGEMTVEEYEAAAIQFLAEARHPDFDRSYFDVGYQPMIELIRYLKAQRFTVYIASGGGRDFMRTVSQQLYGIPREHVIGSAVTQRYREDDQGVAIVRQAEADFLDDGAEKPVRIWNRCGRRPILAGGNANGDLPMLKYTADNRHPSLCLLLNHDDDVREFAYTAGAEDALTKAQERDWTVVSMKRDWRAIFAFREK